LAERGRRFGLLAQMQLRLADVEEQLVGGQRGVRGLEVLQRVGVVALGVERAALGGEALGLGALGLVLAVGARKERRSEAGDSKKQRESTGHQGSPRSQTTGWHEPRRVCAAMTRGVLRRRWLHAGLNGR